jgi:hypothetical protein
MAIDLSENKISEYRLPNFIWLRIQIKFKKIRTWFRQKLMNIPLNTEGAVSINPSISTNFEDQKQHFDDHGWAFIEDIFDDDTYQSLLRNWPKYYYFNPVSQLYKSYDKGFINDEQVYKDYPVLNKLRQYFHSNDFLERLIDFIGDGCKERSVSDLHFTRAFHQSSVIPHLDSVKLCELKKGHPINMIFYLEGSEGHRSGGTCIMGDNDNDIIFEPTKLKNTCIIYRSNTTYHGVLPMKQGRNRWMFSIGSYPDA